MYWQLDANLDANTTMICTIQISIHICHGYASHDFLTCIFEIYFRSLVYLLIHIFKKF